MLPWEINGRKIKNFERSEWATRPSMVNKELIFLVDELTSYVKKRHDGSVCIIHVAYETSGHTQDSQHYHGLAVDLHFSGLALMEQYFCAERFPFTGIGVYPYWNRPGLHLDIRKLANRQGARWWKDKDDEYQELDISLLSQLSREGIA